MERFPGQRTELAFYQQYAVEFAAQFQHSPFKDRENEKQFVVWRKMWVKGQYRKPPFNPKTGEYADPTNPRHWGTLKDALEALKTGEYQGIGWAFRKDDNLTVIDVDHTVGTNRTLYYPGKGLLEQLPPTYTEYSPTDGAHWWYEGKLPNGGILRHRYGEVRSKGYVTLTLRQVPGTPNVIRPAQPFLDAFYERKTGQRLKPQFVEYQRPGPADSKEQPRYSDDYILDQLTARWGRLFLRHWHGDRTLWISSDAKYPSPSEVDMWLVGQFASLTKDPEQIDRLFRRSEHYRRNERQQRWDQQRTKETYGQMTIRKALEPYQRTERSSEGKNG